MAVVAHHHHLCSYLVTATALFLASTLAPLAAGDPLRLSQICVTSGNYTLNSTYQSNIRRIAATLPKNTSTSPMLFAKDTSGAVPDMVYALALCFGDTNASACSDYVTTVFQDAQQLCAYNKDVTVFYDPCLLRYSNKNFLSIGSEFIVLTYSNSRNASTSVKNYTAIVVSPSGSDGRGDVLILMNTQNVTAPFKVFDAAVAALLNATTIYAANSSNRFGTGVERFQTFESKNPTIYGQAQCTPDMSPANCRRCLSGIIQTGSKYFSGKPGGRV